MAKVAIVELSYNIAFVVPMEELSGFLAFIDKPRVMEEFIDEKMVMHFAASSDMSSIRIRLVEEKSVTGLEEFEAMRVKG